MDSGRMAIESNNQGPNINATASNQNINGVIANINNTNFNYTLTLADSMEILKQASFRQSQLQTQ